MTWQPLSVPGPYRTVDERLRHVARERGDCVAMAAYGEQCTYGNLQQWIADDTSVIAARLGGDSAGAVAVLIEPSTRSLGAVLGVIASGRPMVILDPLLPAERQRHIMARADARLLLADPLSWHRAKELVPDARRRVMLGGGTAAASLPQALDRQLAPDPGRGPDDVLALQFTSGSTGRPKAVVQSHGMWLNSCYEAAEALGVGPGVRVALTLPVGFGPGLEVLLFTLLNGGELHVYDQRFDGMHSMGNWVNQHAIEQLIVTPALLRAMTTELVDGEAMSSVRRVVTTGGVVNGRDVAAIRPHLAPGAVYTNWLGSAETGSMAYHDVQGFDEIGEGPLPAGHPAANKHIAVDDGRIVVTSAYLASGYLDEPDLSASRFRPVEGGAVSYRTGDLGHIDAAQGLVLTGRLDDAVRIRGYLVDLSEVEAAVRAVPDITEAVVIALEEAGAASVRLRAYAAVGRHNRAPSEAMVRTSLRRSLPTWMMPAEIVLVDELPRDGAGGLDRAALPVPSGRAKPTPPSGTTEERLAGIWRQVLGVDDVGRADDVAELGGDSLSVEEMLSIVDEVFGVDLTSSHYTAAPTLAEFAALIDNHRLGADWRAPALVPLQRGGSKPRLFLVAGAGGTALAFRALARELGPDQPVYGLQAHGLENRGLPDWTVRRAARRYVKAVLQIAPRGPIALAGHYYGGFVALEMARLLRAQGREPVAVILLDAILDGPIAARLNLVERAPSPSDAGRPRGLRALGVGLWRTRAMLGVMGVVRFRASTQWLLFWEQSMRILDRHRPAEWSGRLTVLSSKDNPDDPDWWAQIGTGSLTVASVPGGHNGMLRAPHVVALAVHVQAALAAAERPAVVVRTVPN